MNEPTGIFIVNKVGDMPRYLPRKSINDIVEDYVYDKLGFPKSEREYDIYDIMDYMHLMASFEKEDLTRVKEINQLKQQIQEQMETITGLLVEIKDYEKKLNE